MATHSTIGYETPDGSYVGVYVHWDSYPQHMLPRLQSMSWDAVAAEVSRAHLQDGWLRDTWPCTEEEFNYRKRLDGTVECITRRGESIT